MPTSVRLDPALDRLVEVVARQTGQTRSEVIRAGVRAYCEQVLNGKELTHYDVLAHMLEGAPGPRSPNVPTDLAGQSERYLREGFAREHAGRDHR